MYICIHTYVHMYIHIYIYMYMYMYMYMYVYIYIYVYIPGAPHAEMPPPEDAVDVNSINKNNTN